MFVCRGREVRRREFITLLGGAAASWPLAVRAQQNDEVRRIGVVVNVAADDPEAQASVAAFKQALQQLGWSEGRNLQIDFRGAAGDPERMQAFAKELVALQPHVILTRSTPVTAALLRQTRTIPIVFTVVSDPVGERFVESLARPGGNATGFTNVEFSLTGKWLELLKTAYLRRIADTCRMLQPSTHARIVRAVCITKLSLEVSLFPGNDADVHHDQ
jgi:putative ABC transport system substrate-binding protein